MPKPLCGSQQTVENCSKDGNTRPPYCLLRNLYAGQKATVRTRHGTIDWFQVGKGVHQGCILSLCLFNLYAESVQFSCSVESDSLRPPELQHARPPCPSPTPGVHSNSCPSSQWCHLAISSSVVPFSSCPQSLPASESFSMSQLFACGGQSTGVSALASFLPNNTQDCTSWEMPGWMKHKLESRLLGEISITSDTQMIPPLWQKGKRN